MTQQEKQEYDRLNPKQKRVYDFTKEMYPHWDHKRLMSKVAFEVVVIETVGKEGGQNINPKDPIVLKNVLEGTKRFLERLGINIGAIKDAINAAINTLSTLISTGLDYLGRKVADIVGWLFD